VPGSGALTGGKAIGVPAHPVGWLSRRPNHRPSLCPCSCASTEQIATAYGDGIGVHGHSTGMGQRSTALIGCPSV
jgi:hypothetical protein